MKTTIKTALFATIIGLSVVSAQAQTITLDNYYNQETKTDSLGQKVRFHYQWDEADMPGFMLFGNAFKKNGAKNLKTLSQAPTLGNLKGTDVFIIVDPDNLKDNPKPNYVTTAQATVIANWVKTGGVLLIMANDQVNADLNHLNLLTAKFGFTFNNDLILHVTGDNFADGEINVGNNPILKTAKTIFIKDASSIKINNKAIVVLSDKNNKPVMVSAKFGKGTVLAVGDPWLYNEYVNGRLPAKYQNDRAADDIAAWLIAQTRKHKK